jgi:hypothetical protein
MIWDVNQAEPWKPAKVFDNHGIEITNVIRMDTETGEVEQIAVDRRGRVILGESGPETIRSVYPAPLRVVECEEAAA